MKTQNIRTILSFNKNYSHINREERNLAAIFYYALLHNNNAQRFLRLIGDDNPCNGNDFGIYFEYAFLRDLWHNIDKEYENDVKRNIILELLEPTNIAELKSTSILEFNTYFGCVPKPSNQFIQSPGNWSIIGNPKINVKGFNQTVDNNEEFEKVCKFKWSFNIKPDIVIHTSKDSAICIEAKLESGEGHYPANPNEEAVFNKRGIKERISQTSLQKYMMEDLLGIETKFVFLVNNSNVKSDSHTTITWQEVFNILDTTNFHPFTLDWISNYS
ncbi:MAG TPA: hypothetical protein G4O18_07715 [Dehalococcoidia bacterium]|nr:hypothetical protein [Dehalococcoidia bacterium]